MLDAHSSQTLSLVFTWKFKTSSLSIDLYIFFYNNIFCKNMSLFNC